MHHPKLYKVTSTGATQVWWLEREGGRYCTHSGQVDGAIVVSEWTRAEPKNVGRSNQTSPEEQARAEVAAKYELKRKKGYRDTPDAAAKSDRFQPMLAKPFDDYSDKLTYPLYSQPKLDGVRCIAKYEGLFSREGNPIVAVPHIYAALRPFFARMPHIWLDGELYNHMFHDDFNEIVSLVRTPKPSEEHLKLTAELVEYHVYDSPADEPFITRIQRVQEICDAVGKPLVFVQTELAPTPAHLDGQYEAYLDQGYEGQIVRCNTNYEEKRTKNLLKRKEFVDSEFEVLDIEEGRGNAAGGAKRVWLRLDTDPNEKFKADMMGTVAQRKQILRDKAKYIGKMATVKYFKQRTPAGIPRFGKVKVFWPEGKI